METRYDIISHCILIGVYAINNAYLYDNLIKSSDVNIWTTIMDRVGYRDDRTALAYKVFFEYSLDIFEIFDDLGGPMFNNVAQIRLLADEQTAT